jgi:O-antigen/teichoic acid export membrane protein
VTVRARLRASRTAPGSRAISWGLIDQAGSSATNFGLSVIAARLLGPSGLGEIAIGFTAYLTLQALFHAFVTDPLVLATAGAEAAVRGRGAQAAITAALGVAVASAALLVLLGLNVPDPVGRGLLLFAPWTGAAIVQDTWRAVLFRDGRGAAAAANDGTWALGMLVIVPAAWLIHTDWAVVSSWGAGATLSAIIGFAQIGVRPTSPQAAVRWLRTHALPLGRWLALVSAVSSAGQQAVVVIVAALLGASSLGGLRAAQVIFAPMTLLFPALGLPALPALTRTAAKSLRRATVHASRYSLIAVILVVAYLVAAVLLREHLLSWLFGASFLRFGDLVFPYGVGQLLIAEGLGFTLMLRVARRGRALLTCQGASTVSLVALVAVLSVADGIAGAAWAMAAGMGIFSVQVTVIAWLQARPGPTAVQPVEI